MTQSPASAGSRVCLFAARCQEMLGKEQAVPTELIGPAQMDFTIQPHDAAVTQYSYSDAWELIMY